MADILVGCAGAGLPKTERWRFPEAGSILERYAARLPALEINSSFYRTHRPSTYARWRDAVPPAFRFSAKLPREITHRRRLEGCEALLDEFLAGTAELGGKLGCLLLQMPPSLAFEPRVAAGFLEALRRRYAGPLAAEPRHASWFAPRAGRLLESLQVARVAADPPRAAGDGEPGGWRRLAYYRLHGAPRIYYSSYSPEFIAALAPRLRGHVKENGATANGVAADVWCIFDNTALGAATANAFGLMGALARR